MSVIPGDGGANSLSGTGAVDTISGFGGNDTLFGLGGNDTLIGGTGNDTMTGGEGSDIYHWSANDGFDVIDVSNASGDDEIRYQGSFYDFNWVFDGNDVVVGVVADSDYDFNDLGGSQRLDDFLNIADGVWMDADLGSNNSFYSNDGGNARIWVSQDSDGGDDQGDHTEILLGSSAGESLDGGGGFRDYIYGFAGNDVLNGSNATRDDLRGGAGDDTLLGRGGDDRLAGGAGTDVMNGGNGTDLARYDRDGGSQGVVVDLVDGTAVDSHGDTDSLISIEDVRGTNFNDEIYGDDAKNFLRGRGGNDTIEGGEGDDTLQGDGGADTFDRGTEDGNDTITDFEVGSDLIDLAGSVAGFGDLTITDQPGGNALVTWGTSDSATLNGVAASALSASDFIFDSRPPLFDDTDNTVDFASVNLNAYLRDSQYDSLDGDDVVTLPVDSTAAAAAGYELGSSFTGGEGNDRITGGGLADTISGGADSDVLFGAGADDILFAGAGVDTLYGGLGADTLRGGSGGDRLFGQGDVDRLFGEAGNDRMFGGNGDDRLDGGGGTDLLRGGGGADVLLGRGQADRLYGDAGDDELYGHAGDDRLVGGDGADLLRGGGGADRLVGQSLRDRLFGQNGDDQLVGGNGDDRLYGGIGADTLGGGQGRDRLFGGAGDDSLVGGAGGDTYIFEDGFGDDTIVGFNALTGAEKIDLSAVTGITDFADLQANHLGVVGGEATITDGTDTITLLGVNLGDLGNNDFVF